MLRLQSLLLICMAGGILGAPFSGSSRKLQITNLGAWTTEQSLRYKFGQFGPISEANIQQDGHGSDNAYALVTYQSLNSAIAARQAFDGSYFEGRTIHVQFVDVDLVTAVVGGVAKTAGDAVKTVGNAAATVGNGAAQVFGDAAQGLGDVAHGLGF